MTTYNNALNGMMVHYYTTDDPCHIAFITGNYVQNDDPPSTASTNLIQFDGMTERVDVPFDETATVDGTFHHNCPR